MQALSPYPPMASPTNLAPPVISSPTPATVLHPAGESAANASSTAGFFMRDTPNPFGACRTLDLLSR